MLTRSGRSSAEKERKGTQQSIFIQQTGWHIPHFTHCASLTIALFETIPKGLTAPNQTLSEYSK